MVMKLADYIYMYSLLFIITVSMWKAEPLAYYH